MKKRLKSTRFNLKKIRFSFLGLLVAVMLPAGVSAFTNPAPITSSTGVQGTIPSPPPTVAATIGTPSNGETFNTEPVTVSGICSGDLLIELFDNGVFSGSDQCHNGSYSIVTYLFTQDNSLVAKDFDALNQEGPNSNTVLVTYNSPAGGNTPGITLTSNYARLGQDPGAVLSWPIIISDGFSPYAIDVSWGDNTPDSLISQATAGVVNITHTYKLAGVYTVLIRATDTKGNTAFLQLSAVANGKINQANAGTSSKTPKSGITLQGSTLWIFAVIAVILSPLGFWLGFRHQLLIVKKKLEQGERPFK